MQIITYTRHGRNNHTASYTCEKCGHKNEIPLADFFAGGGAITCENCADTRQLSDESFQNAIKAAKTYFRLRT